MEIEIGEENINLNEILNRLEEFDKLSSEDQLLEAQWFKKISNKENNIVDSLIMLFISNVKDKNIPKKILRVLR